MIRVSNPDGGYKWLKYDGSFDLEKDSYFQIDQFNAINFGFSE